MQLNVNGETTNIDEGASLRTLIESLDIADTTQGIAIAVNGAVVPREKWGETILQAEDSVEIIRAVQGG